MSGAGGRDERLEPGVIGVPSFSFAGSRRVGCLLIHGFTGAPDEMRPLGEHLAGQGFPVFGVRLPGHGTTVEDLEGRRWGEWFAAVEEGADRLAREAAHVAAVGGAVGGVLAPPLAATRPAAVAALVLCSTAIELRAGGARWAPLIARIPLLPRRWRLLPKGSGQRDIADPVARRESFTYEATPLTGVVELLRLQKIVRAELPRIHQPTLLLHGRHDHTVPVASLERLRAALGARVTEAHVLERSQHVITLDVERERVAALVTDFLERVAPGAPATA